MSTAMLRLGILELVGLGVTLALATPLALFGAAELLAGNPLGGPFVALAILLVVVEQWLMTPSDIPETVAGRVVDAVTRPPEEK